MSPKSLEKQPDEQRRTAIGALGELRANAVRADYEDRFHDHAIRLISYDLANNLTLRHANFRFTNQYYLGAQQTAIENAHRLEPDPPAEIHWGLVDRRVSDFRNKIKTMLGHDFKSSELKPIVDFSADQYENWLIYYQMYPNSPLNAWNPTTDILGRGLLFLVTAEEALLREYLKAGFTNHREEFPQNIGFVVKSQRKRPSGFLVDNRYEIQMKVFDFLRAEAPDFNHPRSLTHIKSFLDSQGHALSKDAIQIRITTPLKKTGLIGSSTAGFFFIQTEEDLIHSFCFHRTKALSILRIMKVYRQRAKEFGHTDLDSECT